MSKLPCWLIAALFVTAGPAAAQTEAPAVDSGTKLSFPGTLGGGSLVRSTSSAAGASYQYAMPNGIEVAVDVYGNGRRVPNGSSHPTIINQFSDELAMLAQVSGGAIEKPAVPSACTYGAYTFRCIVFSAGSVGGRLYGKMLLIGYREHFVKILAQWSQKNSQTVADADKVLNAFVPALMR